MANYKKTFDFDGNHSDIADNFLYVYGNRYKPKNLLKMGPAKARKMFNQDLKDLGADRHFYRGKEADYIFGNILYKSFEAIADHEYEDGSVIEYHFYDSSTIVSVNIVSGTWSVDNL